jgi:hypothetical protein
VKSFEIPKNLNGAELIDELLTAGVTLPSDIFGYKGYKSPEVINDNLFLDVSDDDFDTAKRIVAAHNGTTVAPQPTIEDKLASVGLSLDELRAALGGN